MNAVRRLSWLDGVDVANNKFSPYMVEREVVIDSKQQKQEENGSAPPPTSSDPTTGEELYKHVCFILAVARDCLIKRFLCFAVHNHHVQHQQTNSKPAKTNGLGLFCWRVTGRNAVN